MVRASQQCRAMATGAIPVRPPRDVVFRVRVCVRCGALSVMALAYNIGCGRGSGVWCRWWGWAPTTVVCAACVSAGTTTHHLNRRARGGGGGSLGGRPARQRPLTAAWPVAGESRMFPLPIRPYRARRSVLLLLLLLQHKFPLHSHVLSRSLDAGCRRGG
eukprot:47254-Prymnesium_polylepis.1